MLRRFQETGCVSLKPEWVDGRGESKGDFVEWRVRLGLQVNVLLPADIFAVN